MKIDTRALKASVSIVDVVRERVPLRSDGPQFVGRCPFHQGSSENLHIDPRGSFHCTDCSVAGDVITWVQNIERLSFVDASNWLREKAATARCKGTNLAPVRSRKAGLSAESQARILWASTRDIFRTEAEIYVRSTGFVGKIPNTLRYMTRFEANYGRNRYIEPLYDVLVGVVQSASEIVGVHQLLLAEGGYGLAANDRPKRNLGQVSGNVIRLANPCPAPKVIVCEGLENGLAIMQLHPEIPVWVAPDVGTMHAVKLPASVEWVCFAFENNPIGRESQKKVAELFPRGRRSLKQLFPGAGFATFSDQIHGICRT